VSGDQLLTLLSCAAFGLATSISFLLFVDAFDAFAAAHTADLVERMRQIEFSTAAVPGWLRVWGIAMAATGVGLGYFLEMPPLAAIGLFIAFRSCRLIFAMLIDAREGALREQLAKSAGTLANFVRSGATLAEAINGVHAETPFPLKPVFGRIARDIQFGRPETEALREARDRLKLDHFSVFSSALLACMRHGGELSRSLSRIALSLREQQRLERKIRSDTAGGRLVVVSLAVFPLIFLGIFRLIFPDGTMLLLTTFTGQVILTIVLGLTYASVRWSMAILDIKA
jgi:tight adherence protein B